MKRTVLRACVLLSAAVFMAGCGEKPVGNPEKMTIKWCGNTNQPADVDSDVERYLEEKFNVDIETISITSNYEQRLGAMIA